MTGLPPVLSPSSILPPPFSRCESISTMKISVLKKTCHFCFYVYLLKLRKWTFRKWGMFGVRVQGELAHTCLPQNKCKPFVKFEEWFSGAYSQKKPRIQ
jgi:hypothetical protein